MQLCIEQLLYRIKFEGLFVLFFFCAANIYWPSLGKVRLGRPNPKPIQPLNFFSEGKKDHSTQNCMNYKGMKPDFQFSF